MGKIFTWEQVVLRQIPYLDDFYRLANKIREDIASHPHVIAAMFFGSIARNAVTRRSDINIALIYDDGNDVIIQDLQKLQDMARQNFITLDIVAVPITLARSELHPFGPSFIAHFNCILQNHEEKARIKSDVLDYITCLPMTLEQDLERFFRQQLSYIRKAVINLNGQPFTSRFLKILLDFPMHAARQLAALAKESSLTDDSTQTVLEILKASLDNKQKVLLDAILDLNDTHTKYIERIFVDRPLSPEKKEFDDHIQELTQASGLVLKLFASLPSLLKVS